MTGTRNDNAFFILLIFVFSLAFSLSGSAGWKQKNSLSELSAVEIADLQFMREEEKLARDIYLNMLDEWGLLIFENIAQSEQNHMDAIKRQLVKTDVEDPVNDETVRGDFKNEFLDALYIELMEMGIQSEMNALTVGGNIEEIDIVDLRTVIGRTDHDGIIRTYENLLCGSRNHLRAFIHQIDILGGEYTRVALSEEDFSEIVDSPVERQCGNTEQKGKMQSKRKGKR